MPAMTNLLVKDDAATPVEFTLIPITDSPNPLYRGNVSSVPLEGQMRVQMMTEQLKNGNFKVTCKLEDPVMETLGASGTSFGYVAPPKVAYVTTCIFTMFCDRRSTSQNRSDALKKIIGLLQGASATTATGTLDQASAGSAFLNSTAAGPSLFTSLILPN